MKCTLTKIKTSQKYQLTFHPSNLPYGYGEPLYPFEKLVDGYQKDSVLSYYVCHWTLTMNSRTEHETSRVAKRVGQKAHYLQLLYSQSINKTIVNNIQNVICIVLNIIIKTTFFI